MKKVNCDISSTVISFAFFLSCLFNGFQPELFAQNKTFVPLQHEVSWSYEQNRDSGRISLHPIKPYLEDMTQMIHDSKSKFLLTRSFYNHNYLKRSINTSIYPILSGMGTVRSNTGQNEGTNLYNAQAGIQAGISIGRYLAFSGNFYYNQQSFQASKNVRIDSTGIIPGHGLYHFKNSGGVYGWADSRFSLALMPVRYLRLEVGNNKHFIGEGYRSLFLSDQSDAYPYVKIHVKAWKIEYMYLLSWMHDQYLYSNVLSMGKKNTATHMLSWNANRFLNFNLFETVIWRAEDSLGYRGIEVNYLNPLVFLRPVENSVGSPDNVLLGLGGKILFFKKWHAYGQFIMDEFRIDDLISGNGSWTNKYGYQIGIKNFHVAGIKNMFIMGEYNRIRPYTYSHKYTLQNYGNMGESLAHPMGANTSEILGVLRYEYERWSAMGKLIYASYGADTLGSNWGGNIYLNYSTREQDYGNETLQGVKTSIFTGEFKVAYLMNQSWNLRFEAGWAIQKKQSEFSENELANYIFFGIKTLLYNDNEPY